MSKKISMTREEYLGVRNNGMSDQTPAECEGEHDWNYRGKDYGTCKKCPAEIGDYTPLFIEGTGMSDQEDSYAKRREDSINVCVHGTDLSLWHCRLCEGDKPPFDRIPDNGMSDQSPVNNGGNGSYYDIPPGCTQIQDIIYAKKMCFSRGNMQKAIIRWGDKGNGGTYQENVVYNLEKIMYFAQYLLDQHYADMKKEAMDNDSD